MAVFAANPIVLDKPFPRHIDPELSEFPKIDTERAAAIRAEVRRSNKN